MPKRIQIDHRGVSVQEDRKKGDPLIAAFAFTIFASLVILGGSAVWWAILWLWHNMPGS